MAVQTDPDEYHYIVNSKGDIIYHPTMELGRNILDLKDDNGFYRVARFYVQYTKHPIDNEILMLKGDDGDYMVAWYYAQYTKHVVDNEILKLKD